MTRSGSPNTTPAAALADVVGAGRLGDLAIRYGYERFQTDVMVVTFVLLILLVQLLQMLGDRLVSIPAF